MNKLKIHPNMTHNGHLVDLEMYNKDGYARFHFSSLGGHIHGYYLFVITNGGIRFDEEVHRHLDGTNLDLDSEKADILKIIGVDVI